MREDGKIMDLSLEFFLLEESIGKDIHMVQVVQEISAQLAKADHPKHAQILPDWVLFRQEVRSILESDLFMVGNNLWYVPHIIKHELRQRDYSSSTAIPIELLIEPALELHLHQSLANFVLAAIVASDDGANGIPEEGIEEDFAVIGRKWIETYREWVLFFLGELPIRLHAFIMKELMQTKNAKNISYPALMGNVAMCRAIGIIEFNNNGNGHSKRQLLFLLTPYHQNPHHSLALTLAVPLRAEAHKHPGQRHPEDFPYTVAEQQFYLDDNL